MKKYIIAFIIIIIVAGLVALAYYYFPAEKLEEVTTGDAVKDDMIFVESPALGEEIDSPLVVSGQARGFWFFEATFPIKLLDSEGNVVAQHYATAKEDWMTEEMVPFEAIIEFEKPDSSFGVLILEKANPSGLPENADEVRIDIRFEKQNINGENDYEAYLEGRASTWIKNNASTYKYDGMDLELLEIRGLDLVGCENCYELEFTFDSLHAGYGNREGEVVAQVITSHNIVVTVEDGDVVKAITDQVYDEINQELANIDA